MSEGWLRCWVGKGMFSTERAVQYPQAPEADSWFVPSDRVRDIEGETGFVAVRIHRENGSTWARIPTEYGIVVRVDETDLVSA